LLTIISAPGKLSQSAWFRQLDFL